MARPAHRAPHRVTLRMAMLQSLSFIARDGRFCVSLALVALLPCLAAAKEKPRAAPTTVSYRAGFRDCTVAAAQRKGKVWVDFLEVAQCGKLEMTKKNGIYFFELVVSSMALNPMTSVYSVRLKGQRKWVNEDLPADVYWEGSRLMTPLVNLPFLLGRGVVWDPASKRLMEAAHPTTADEVRLIQPRPINFLRMEGVYALHGEDAPDKSPYVDLKQVADALNVPMTEVQEVLFFNLGDSTSAVNMHTSGFSSKGEKDAGWKNSQLPTPLYFSGDRVMVTIDSLPLIFNSPFTYHLQKRELSRDDDESALAGGRFRPVNVRHQILNQKIWVSLEDLAQLLNLQTFSGQSTDFGIVMPDFTIMSLKVEDSYIYKRDQVYRRMQDPMLVIGGQPYITVPSVQTLFDLEARWDKSAGRLLLPVDLQRASQDADLDQPLRLMGFQSHPLRLRVEKLSYYYQHPAPIRAASNSRPYSSIRDFLTNEPVIHPDASSYDKSSWNMRANLEGTVGSRPLEGGGEFEKVGTRGRVVNGNLRWGYPGFQVFGGRDYVRLANLDNQLELVDQGGMSYSNDTYGEGNKTFTVKLQAVQGQVQFQIYSSTDLFTQSVDYVQDISRAGLSTLWRLTDRQSLTMSLEQFYFKNRIKRSYTEINPFLIEIFGEEITEFVRPTDQSSLRNAILTDHHATTLLDTTYNLENLFQLSGTYAMSYFKDPNDNNTGRTDSDWAVRGVIGPQGRQIEASYEYVGNKYRSIGDPTTYQGRNITRVAPSLDLTSVWSVYGEFRRENVYTLDYLNQPANRNDYFSATNLLHFKRTTIRNSATNFDNGAYGKRWQADMDVSHYLTHLGGGLGGVWNSYWDFFDMLYKQSYTGRATMQVSGKGWRVSLGEDLTRNHYRLYQVDRWESVSSLQAQWGRYRFLTQYALAPKFFLEPDILYTGYCRLSRRFGEKTTFNLFFSRTSLDRGLRHPEVWRGGFEYTYEFQ